MLVYGFVGDTSGFMEIENDLRSKQKFVGGLIEVIRLTEEIDLIVNEEYLLNGSEPRLLIYENDEIVNVVMGDCFVCRNDREGNFTDIMREDISIIQEYLVHINCDELKMLASFYLYSMMGGN